MISKSEKKLLGLSKNEIAVLDVLERYGPLSMQEIADKTRLHRTTAYWPLQKLHKRGLADYELVGKRKHWRATNRLSLLAKADGHTEGVRLVKGVEAMRALYNKALHLKRTERVLILEGNRAVHSIASKGGVEFMNHWHAHAHDRGIIVESVLGEKVLHDLANKLVSRRVVKSLARWTLWIGYIVPDEFIDSDAALILFRREAILADWNKERAMHIQSPDLVSMLGSFCKVYKATGRKVDIVKYVRTIASGN